MTVMRRAAFDARNIRRRSRPGSPFRSGAGHSRRGWSGARGPWQGRSGPHRLVLEVPLWLVGQYSEQGVLLHVCSKAFQRRPFRMTSSEVGARRPEGPSVALGVIPPLCATLGPVLAGPEGCSRGRWRSGPSKWRHTAAPAGRGQGAPRTCRCIETILVRTYTATGRSVREHHAPVGALRLFLGGLRPSDDNPSGSTTHL